MIRVLIADDQSLVSQGLSSLLSLESDIEVVGVAANGREAVLLCEKLNPDVVLMDIQMPILDGIKATGEILSKNNKIKVLALTTFVDDEFIIDSIRQGAAGYLLKNMPSELLASAIRASMRGLSQMDPEVVARLSMHLVKTEERKLPDLLKHLNKREIEILQLLAEGLSNREIAGKLNITEGTVRNYVSNILLVLGLNDRTQAAIWALKNLV
ncbi:MAG: response regulator transcription factor [Candidatus Obscuribacter sp.]|nr:response regulator transcription factor [Candidatus Melainabacteria bacterium]MDX1988905.1 response regulator transcription factor [Candidatus Obscuribacter sp.]